jgi:hypothetical protein
VVWEKGRSDRVCRHDAHIVDVRERNVRNAVLEAMLDVLYAQLRFAGALMLEGRRKLRSDDLGIAERPMRKKMAMPPDVLHSTFPASTSRIHIFWATLA